MFVTVIITTFFLYQMVHLYVTTCHKHTPATEHRLWATTQRSEILCNTALFYICMSKPNDLILGTYIYNDLYVHVR